MKRKALLIAGQVVGLVVTTLATLLSAVFFAEGTSQFRRGTPDNLEFGIGLVITLVLGGPGFLLFWLCRRNIRT